MAKVVLKVTILPCGRKAKDSTGKEYEIDFNFSNPDKIRKLKTIPFCQQEGITFQSIDPGSKQRGQIQANQKIEIL